MVAVVPVREASGKPIAPKGDLTRRGGWGSRGEPSPRTTSRALIFVSIASRALERNRLGSDRLDSDIKVAISQIGAGPVQARVAVSI